MPTPSTWFERQNNNYSEDNWLQEGEKAPFVNVYTTKTNGLVIISLLRTNEKREHFVWILRFCNIKEYNNWVLDCANQFIHELYTSRQTQFP